MPWVRSGECNRCGECCLTGDPFGGIFPPGAVHTACPLFYYSTNANGATIGTCSVRTGEISKSVHEYVNNYTTIACDYWPFAPEQIANYPSCSYTFTWVEE
jgi:hypothetical protein